ncbi:MAG: TolC family protein [Pseudomonadota bacterium]
MRRLILLPLSLLLSGCFAGQLEMADFKGPSLWQNASDVESLDTPVDVQALENWWHNFNDPVLSALVEKALEVNPDLLIAEARVLEARGLRRTARSSFFPQIGATGVGGREKGLFAQAADTYDVRFDASYEIDLFGRVRNNASASQNTLFARKAEYDYAGLTLVAEVARSYIDMRANEKQLAIALDNLETQEKTLELIQNLRDFGESPQLDVERAETLVNTTRASVPEFKRLAENARLRLAVLTGSVPEGLMDVSGSSEIPGSDVAPVLMAPAKILAQRPDIRAAASNLAARTDLAEAATAEIFPTFSLGGFYGAAESGFASTTQIWQIALNAAVSVLDFGRIAGQIDAARAREKEAFEQYRKTVLEAVSDVETSLNNYAKADEQSFSLFQAYENADAAFNLSTQLFTEGEISFLDVLDAQRTLNDTQSALVTAEAARASALIALYKSLGVGP